MKTENTHIGEVTEVLADLKYRVLLEDGRAGQFPPDSFFLGALTKSLIALFV